MIADCVIGDTILKKWILTKGGRLVITYGHAMEISPISKQSLNESALYSAFECDHEFYLM